MSTGFSMLVKSGAAVIGSPMAITSWAALCEAMGFQICKGNLNPSGISMRSITLIESRMLMRNLLLLNGVHPAGILSQWGGLEPEGKGRIPSGGRHEANNRPCSYDCPIGQAHKVLVAPNGTTQVHTVLESLVGLSTKMLGHEP